MDPITILVLVALLVLSEMLKPKPKVEQARPSGIGDFQFPTATEGRVIPLIWGRVMLSGPNVVWYGDLLSEPIVKKLKTGIFSSKKETVGFRYYLGMQMALCRGPIDGIRRVWVGDTKVYDGGLATSTFDVNLPSLLGGDDLGQGGVKATVTIYPGSDTQAADPYLANFQDAGTGSTRTPRYTGTAHLVVRRLGSTGATLGGAYLGNSTSVQAWKFEAERYPAIFSGQSAGENKVNSNADANPVNVLYELLTNKEWGYGEDSADIDVGVGSSFKMAADTMIAEGNGFAMTLDQPVQRSDFRAEVERQMGGVCFFDHKIGKWRISLARADYDVDTVPQLSPSNVMEVQNFTRGSWSDTTNQTVVKYNKRVDQYKESFAPAIDPANALIQGGGTVTTVSATSSQVNYPGVKDPALAGQIAWRDLRSLSYPLAKCDFVLDRSFWDLDIGDVVAWTDPKYGFVKLPMRVLRVDYGRLEDNKITASCVQDVFYFAAKSFGTPPASGWVVPTATLVAYPANEQVAVEAPRAVVERDPLFSGDIAASKVLAFARRQGGESSVVIKQRHSSGTPTGAFVECGTVVSLVKIGTLASSLAQGTAVPTVTISLASTLDTQAALLDLFDGQATTEDLGKRLTQLVLCGNEWMLVSSAQAGTGSNIDLKNVYRGVMDSVQEAHSSGAYVYMVFAGAGLADTSFTNTDNVDVELRARAPSGDYAGSVTTISLAMDRRTVRPAPVANLLFDGSGTPYTTPNLQASGSGLNGLRTQVSWYRRDYRVGDEVLALLSDGSTVLGSTVHQLEVRADPTGANTLVGSVSAYAFGVGPVNVTLVDVVTAAALGTTLRFLVRTKHDAQEGYSALVNRQSAYFDVVPTSATYSGKFYLGGGLAANVDSNSYTAVATGTFTLNIGAAQSTANVQVSKNGGAYSTVIAAGLVTGTFSATSGDTIRVRRTVSEAPNPNFVELKNPSAAVVAYGSFKN